MVFKSDLYDMGFALSIMRNSICEKSNPAILSNIITVLESYDMIEDNQVRKAISNVEGIDYKLWGYAFHNNVYAIHQIMKNPILYCLLIDALTSLKKQLLDGDFVKAYALLDCIHCLPIVIADNNFMIPKSFWRIQINNYRRKWDSVFLLKEQKLLVSMHKLKKQ